MFWISRCKLLCKEWINTKILPCRTGNYIQHPVIYCNEREHEKNAFIRMCVSHMYVNFKSLYCSGKINTTFQNSHTSKNQSIVGNGTRGDIDE